ncbi:MAG TPA: VWA domain-containing protein [Vicinamibacteria bacterium]|jgi:Ca-activated chloride channel family protein
MTRRAALGAALAALPALVAGQAPAPRPTRRPPTFEVGIDVINLNVSVTDGQNHYVTKLAERDFAVFEDGVRQDLTLFTHEDLPISMVLLIDGSASMDEKLRTAQEAGVRFCKTLRAEDVAQVVQFNDRITALQDFTNDQALLEKAIRRTEATGPTALHNALYVSLKELGKQKRAAELRRRAIVLLSDGEDTASLVDDEQVLELARKSEIAIYSISLQAKRVPERNRMAFSQATHLLTTLSRESGGQVYFTNSLSELDTVYDRIAEELRTQYNLGYVSANAKKDGRWRRIVVRVPSRDDLTIRHKIGYYAPRG